MIAEDPHPAHSDDSVTHPHVQSEGVCEGDAKLPIRNALSQLRLLDFFQIVGSLLRTYNSGSPYVALLMTGTECTVRIAVSQPTRNTSGAVTPVPRSAATSVDSAVRTATTSVAPSVPIAASSVRSRCAKIA